MPFLYSLVFISLGGGVVLDYCRAFCCLIAAHAGSWNGRGFFCFLRCLKLATASEEGKREKVLGGGER